jgi:hypothetical protein
MKRIGFDVDGVLADFVSGFCDLTHTLIGKQIPTVPTVWDWHRQAGVTEAEDKRLWSAIALSPSFWYQLEPDPAMTSRVWRQLRHLERSNAIYFLTWRGGATAKQQTEGWLRCHGLACPTVLIAECKAPIVRSLGLECYIDDRPSYCMEVREGSPHTRVYLRQRPYNAQNEAALVAAGCIPVPDVAAMLAADGLDALAVARSQAG